MNSGRDKPHRNDREAEGDASDERIRQSGPQVVPPVALLRGAHNYRLIRKLGEGGQGAVHEAENLDTQKRLAIKLLRSVHDGALARFKREFRTRERVRHRSLAEFGELACCDGLWFFTMSLVQGIPLLRYLAEAETRSESQLRGCFAQLADALVELHAAGLIHRDVKSDNVLVEADGRVVLVDLGLVVDVYPELTTELIGTPVYMAPEQWSGARPSIASDWYAFGVLLFEALCGKPPFSGSQVDIFVAKTQQPAPSAGSSPDAPRDLVSLCDGLLRRDWVERFGAAEVLRGFDSSRAGRIVSSETELELVGRDAELQQLETALSDCEQGRCVLVFVEGLSGIGKTTLLRAFGDRAIQRRAWFLTGRCYEAESVPFKAFDEALDGLARTLDRKGKTSLEVYRPRHSHILARVFPTLSLLQSHPGTDSIRPVDPVELRATAIRALTELLARMADEGPVTICLDDVQWADADSIELLEALTHSDFPLLIVASFQSEETRPAAFHKITPQCVIRLPPLEPSATRQLAERVSSRLGVLSDDTFDQMHAETGGSPFLVCEWARFVDEHGTAPTHALRRLLETRIAELWPQQRKLLVLIAISGEPVEVAVAAHVAQADEISDVLDLRRKRLIRTLARERDVYVDIYHNSIREVASSFMSEVERRELHGLVAHEYARRGAPAERRVAHLIAAGDRDAAAELALQSAHSAEESLAFVRAAELYELSRGLLDGTPQSVTITVQEAKAWQNALRPLRAGESLLRASALCAEPERASELLRLAGDQLLLGGDFVRGLAAVEQALRDYGLALPESSEAAIHEAFSLYAALEARGIMPAENVATERKRTNRIALCLSIARCSHHVDLRGIPFALRGLLDALDSGDAALLPQAYAVFVMVTASHMPNPLVEPALEQCRALSQRSVDPYAHALREIAIAELEHFRGQYASAERACERAERTLLTSCAGVSRELGQVRSMRLVILHSNKGDFRSHIKRALEWLDDADRRNDVFNGNWLRAACSLAWMAQDTPARAREEIARAERAWPASMGGTFEAACALYLDALDRYEDRPDVRSRPAQGRASVLGSLVVQAPLLQGYVQLQRGWGCLRELGVRAQKYDSNQRQILRSEIEQVIAELRRLALPIWTATADAFEANLRLLSEPYGDEVDSLLERAHTGFYSAQLFALAACAKRRRGEIALGELGEGWLAEADLELDRLGVKSPQKFARAYFSMFSV